MKIALLCTHNILRLEIERALWPQSLRFLLQSSECQAQMLSSPFAWLTESERSRIRKKAPRSRTNEIWERNFTKGIEIRWIIRLGFEDLFKETNHETHKSLLNWMGMEMEGVSQACFSETTQNRNAYESEE